MKRRSFLQASLAAAGSSVLVENSIASERKESHAEFYEIRVYSLKADKQELLDDYLRKALLPTLKRMGVGPVGVFVEKAGQDQIKVYVVIVHPTADQAAALSARLAADEEFQKSAQAYLAAPAKDPVYSRIESSLLVALDGMPRLEKPDTSKPRLLNLRIYESHNERAARKKIEMFNMAELAIFRRVGLTPVFFGETLVGGSMPNLTYLLVFPDEAGRNAAWSKFGADAEWQKLRAIPEYADKEIVSHITNKILTPAPYSEI
jgi:hypothetical protein